MCLPERDRETVRDREREGMTTPQSLLFHSPLRVLDKHAYVPGVHFKMLFPELELHSGQWESNTLNMTVLSLPFKKIFKRVFWYRVCAVAGEREKARNHLPTCGGGKPTLQSLLHSPLGILGTHAHMFSVNFKLLWPGLEPANYVGVQWCNHDAICWSHHFYLFILMREREERDRKGDDMVLLCGHLLPRSPNSSKSRCAQLCLLCCPTDACSALPHGVLPVSCHGLPRRFPRISSTHVTV